MHGTEMQTLVKGDWWMRQRQPTSWSATCIRVCVFPARLIIMIHALLALASLGNVCPSTLLHWGYATQRPTFVFCKCRLRLSMPPTANHQPDNSYGGCAIWRVSKFAIPLVVCDKRMPITHKSSSMYDRHQTCYNVWSETRALIKAEQTR